MTPIRVAVFSDQGVTTPHDGPAKVILDVDPGFAAREVSAAAIRDGVLDGCDAVIFPGGRALHQSEALGDDGWRRLKAFIRDGGGYVGFCAGAYLLTTNSPGAGGLINARVKSLLWERGKTDLPIELTDAGKALFGDPGGPVMIHYQNGPVFEPAGVAALPPYETLAVFRGEIAENGTPEGIQIGAPAMATAPYGRGRLVVSSPHPEETPALHAWVKRAVRFVVGIDPSRLPPATGT